VLGCPNLPREPIADADAGAEAAGHAADSDVGVIFAARRGGGAHVGPLKSGGAAFLHPNFNILFLRIVDSLAKYLNLLAKASQLVCSERTKFTARHMCGQQRAAHAGCAIPVTVRTCDQCGGGCPQQRAYWAVSYTHRPFMPVWTRPRSSQMADEITGSDNPAMCL